MMYEVGKLKVSVGGNISFFGTVSTISGNKIDLNTILSTGKLLVVANCSISSE